MAKFKRHVWHAPDGYQFVTVLSRSTYSVAVLRDGHRVEWTGRKWGPSLTDALMMAAYSGDPSRALGAIAFLFNRIDRDFEGDRHLYSNLFAKAQLVVAAP